jgi:beta-lactamase class A
LNVLRRYPSEHGIISIEERRAFSNEAADEMLDILHKQEFRSGIPAGVPQEVRTEAQFAHKTGDISTVTHDAGIVYLPGRSPYVVAILTEWKPDARNRRETVARLSRVVYDHMSAVEVEENE